MLACKHTINPAVKKTDLPSSLAVTVEGEPSPVRLTKLRDRFFALSGKHARVTRPYNRVQTSSPAVGKKVKAAAEKATEAKADVESDPEERNARRSAANGGLACGSNARIGDCLAAILACLRRSTNRYVRLV